MKKKLPSVTEQHIIIINNKKHVIRSVSWTETIGESIDNGQLENSHSEILEYIKQSD